MAFKTWQTGVHIQQDRVLIVALDRDKNYDKVKRAYDAMVDGAGTRYE